MFKSYCTETNQRLFVNKKLATCFLPSFCCLGNKWSQRCLCEHLRTVSENSLHPSVVNLTSNDIESCANNEISEISHVLKEDTIQKCKSLINSVTASSHNSIVPWIFPNYIHLSVFSDKRHYNARLNRFVVNYCKVSGQFDCGCCTRKVICVHKAISLCFLLKENLLADRNSFTVCSMRRKTYRK